MNQVVLYCSSSGVHTDHQKIVMALTHLRSPATTYMKKYFDDNRQSKDLGSRFCGCFVRLGVQSSWALAKVPPSELLILEQDSKLHYDWFNDQRSSDNGLSTSSSHNLRN